MKQNENMITVGGKKIPTEIKQINIRELVYWRENPRVDSIIKEKCANGKITEATIENALWELESVKWLYQDIKSNGGLIDEILVKGNMVLEGNSRLCAYRFLYEHAISDAEKQQWSRIRARIIPNDSSDEVIFTILGTWHIKGKAEWRTYEKAAYIYRMYSDYNKSIKDIATMVKQSETEVGHVIETYETMQRRNITETRELKKFSAIFEIVKSKDMKKIKEQDPTLFDKCIDAVKKDRFERAEQVRDLPKVIKDKNAKRSFFVDGESFSDALDIAKSRHPEHEDSFYSQMRKVTTLLACSDVRRIDEIKKDGNKKYIFEKLYKQVNSFCKKIGIKQ
jgi:hypothetical protein